MGSPITEIHSVRPEQKQQNDTEYPKDEDHFPSARSHPNKKIVSCSSTRLGTLSVNTAKQASVLSQIIIYSYWEPLYTEACLLRQPLLA
jgi:hypothetical protein